MLLEVVSAVLLFQYNSYQGSVWFSSANAVTGKIMEIDAWIGTFFSMGDANQDLTARNIQLEQEVAALREQLIEIQRRDSTWKPSAQEQLLSVFKTIPAKVVGNSVSRPDNLITINKGTADGVRPDMGVACGTGVVGIVYMASDHYAVAKFEEGDTIETSGYSDVFPPGILVGHIMKSHDSKDALSYRLQVKLSTDYARLRDVSVIDNASLKERLEILRAAEDSIKPQRKQ